LQQVVMTTGVSEGNAGPRIFYRRGEDVGRTRSVISARAIHDSAIILLLRRTSYLTLLPAPAVGVA
jgi:hypothetical protein